MSGGGGFFGGIASAVLGNILGQKPEQPALPPPPVVKDNSAEIAAQEAAKLRSLKRRKTATQSLFSPLGGSSSTSGPDSGNSTLG